MTDDAYEGSGNTPVFIESDGTLHTEGAQIAKLKHPAFLDASALPTTDPNVAGRVWRNSGVLTVSAG